MPARRVLHRIVALLAAYALALQAVVAAVASAPVPADSALPRCPAALDTGLPAVPGHVADRTCCLAGCSAAPLLPPFAPTPVYNPLRAASVPAVADAPPAWPSERPRNSRAPPA